MSYDVSNVICRKCGHIWTAVRPTDAKPLECPKCGNFGTMEARDTLENEQLFLAEAVSDFFRENEWLNRFDRQVLAVFRYDNVCKYSDIGDYKCAVTTTHGYCCDTCLQHELHELWAAGVITIGSCCGHGRKEPYIQVCNGESVKKMHELGYTKRPTDENGNGGNCFVPKTYLPIMPGAAGGRC